MEWNTKEINYLLYVVYKYCNLVPLIWLKFQKHKIRCLVVCTKNCMIFFLASKYSSKGFFCGNA